MSHEKAQKAQEMKKIFYALEPISPPLSLLCFFVANVLLSY